MINKSIRKLAYLVCASMLMVTTPVIADEIVGPGEKNCSVTAEKKAGGIEFVTVEDEDVVTLTMSDTAERFIELTVSQEEKQKVDEGSYIKLVMSTQKATAEKESDYKDSYAVDINITKIVADDENYTSNVETSNVSQLGNKISLAIEAPFVLKENQALGTFKMTRLHDGVTEEIDAVYSKDANAFFFKSDRFSVYTLYYNIVTYTPSGNGNSGSGTTTTKPDTGSGSKPIETVTQRPSSAIGTISVIHPMEITTVPTGNYHYGNEDNLLNPYRETYSVLQNMQMQTNGGLFAGELGDEKEWISLPLIDLRTIFPMTQLGAARLIYSNNRIWWPDGNLTDWNGNLIATNVKLLDGKPLENGTVPLSNGNYLNPDGSIVDPSGAVIGYEKRSIMPIIGVSILVILVLLLLGFAVYRISSGKTKLRFT